MFGIALDSCAVKHHLAVHVCGIDVAVFHCALEPFCGFGRLCGIAHKQGQAQLCRDRVLFGSDSVVVYGLVCIASCTYTILVAMSYEYGAEHVATIGYLFLLMQQGFVAFLK